MKEKIEQLKTLNQNHLDRVKAVTAEVLEDMATAIESLEQRLAQHEARYQAMYANDRQ